MKDIKIIYQHLSQYHSGQIVESSAHLCQDIKGTWHTVVTRYDRSDQSTDIKHSQHTTREEAARSLAGDIIVSHESSCHIDLRRSRRLLRALENIGVDVTIHFDPLTLFARVGDDRCAPHEIQAKLVSLAGQYLDVKIGRYHHPSSDSDAEFLVDSKKTEAARRGIRNALS